MSSTLNILFQIKGTVNTSLIQEPTDGLYAPVQVTLSSDIVYRETVSVADTTVTELLTIGSGDDVASSTFIVLIPTVKTVFCWQLATASDNNTAECAANVPFILSTGKANPYNATPATAIADTPAAIDTITAYQSTGGAGKVHIFSAA